MTSSVTANCKAAAATMGSMTIGATYKATPGVLRMDEDEFTFTPNDTRSAMKLNVDFRSIKCHKFGSKQARSLLKLCRDPGEGGDYMFEFDNVADRDRCRDFIARVLGQHQGTIPPRPNVPPESVASTGLEQLSDAEVERRMKLLRENRDLQKLHMKFVLGKVLQESEFWATRKNLIDEEANKASKQRPGLKSVMLDLRPSADGQINRVTFSVNKEIIHQVERLKGAMAQIYQKLQDMKESAPPEARHELSRLVKPMTQAMDAAFSHDLEQRQKSSKGNELVAQHVRSRAAEGGWLGQYTENGLRGCIYES